VNPKNACAQRGSRACRGTVPALRDAPGPRAALAPATASENGAPNDAAKGIAVMAPPGAAQARVVGVHAGAAHGRLLAGEKSVPPAAAAAAAAAAAGARRAEAARGARKRRPRREPSATGLRLLQSHGG